MASWGVRKRAAETGFSLLEVLVAFVVLAVSLGIILQIFSLATRTTRSAETYQQALLLAESKLSELMAAQYLEPGRDNGFFDGGEAGGVIDDMHWQTEVSEYEFPDDPAVDNPTLVPYLIEVSVRWGPTEGRDITLTTIRLERQP